MDRRDKPKAFTSSEIMVALSGGVDSAVSAWLLQSQGHRVAGMFMKNWEEDDRLGACSAEADAADAQAVADLLGIRLHRRNFAAEYWDFVFEDFVIFLPDRTIMIKPCFINKKHIEGF